ncbi:MAG TPA: NYN domain-containing protein [Bacillota bacterium]|nr:NYN domain-containing protein [Bacillota bacterium]HPF41934.1 NYN domain-containing protein [Bacillota bacterium]HPJ85593.1 NYN domain-containing protein [Bacillota bacterium]HPQ61455.1 NYN domain-containing protein [Bacillota bacterium]HRX91711.1 NYN domain-containing protein [Candidatus Izemoplasmatales bacterium]
MEIENKSIALLIDAENISPAYIEIIIDEANKYGKINYRRVYGDWTTTQLNTWKQRISEFGLTPVQQYSYTSGKNASDFTLIIDAMDILYSGKVNSFCIVSSDSDFTKLVTRLREDDMFVFGMGESKTPISLVNSCETFSYLDKMVVPEHPEITPCTDKKDDDKTSKKKTNGKSESSIPPLSKIKAELKNIINDNMEDDGWAYWSLIAQLFQRKFPGFHPRNYGSNMRPLNFFEKMEEFEVKKINTVIHIRNKA